MDSPSAPAEAANVPATAADAAADFENYLFGEEDEQPEDNSAPESDEAEPEGDEIELEDEDTGTDEGEPHEAIAAPASLNAEEKAAFAQLPKEAQEAWAASENRRNSQVQEATTKASQAQREAEARAATADAAAKAQYGQQLEKFVAAFEPQRPDPRNYTDQLSYLTDKAQYDDAKAQHDQLVQQARSIQSEADTQAQQVFIQQRDRELMTIPQIANPETRGDYLQGIMGLAQEVGFDPANIVQSATGHEFKALASIYDRLTTAEAKAAKYDAAMSRKMQKVRASKGRTLRPNAAPQEGSRAATAAKAWDRVANSRNKDEQANAFADYLGL